MAESYVQKISLFLQNIKKNKRITALKGSGNDLKLRRLKAFISKNLLMIASRNKLIKPRFKTKNIKSWLQKLIKPFKNSL